MVTLLADINIQGHIEIMVKRMQSDAWIDFWNHLGMSCVSFADSGLDAADSDADIWRRCQEQRIYLLTNNRNDDGPDSLESTIRNCNTAQSLPFSPLAMRNAFERNANIPIE